MNLFQNRLGLVCVLSTSCVLNNIAAFNITINNGISASASATNGAVVRIYANVPDQNKVFNSWAGNITGVADRYSPTTSVTVAEADVTLTATYVNAPFKLSVTQDKTSVYGWYPAEAQVSLKARQPALFKSFKWTGNGSADTNAVADLTSWDTSVTIPQEDVKLTAVFEPEVQSNAYLIVDLSDGDISYLDAPPVNGWDNTYRDTKMVFRRIEAGAYQMGTNTGLGYIDAHTVTLTESFYIGVFEVTQRQWAYVAGGYPSVYTGSNRNYHPVENISYEDIRGAYNNGNGYSWPSDASVDPASFVGVMRHKAGCDGFDLPAEAQWEYACRAGTTGEWFVDSSEVFDVAVVSVYGHPPLISTAEVGSLDCNLWGLYDMHGNVFEWGLDWFHDFGLGTVAQVDPAGPTGPDSQYKRVIKSGSYDFVASPYAKAGYRAGMILNTNSFRIGFRMALHLNKVTVADSTVNNGANDYAPGTKVSISAVEKAGFEFSEWSVTPTGTELGSLFVGTSAETVIEVPNALGHITVSAVYQ